MYSTTRATSWRSLLAVELVERTLGSTAGDMTSSASSSALAAALARGRRFAAAGAGAATTAALAEDAAALLAAGFLAAGALHMQQGRSTQQALDRTTLGCGLGWKSSIVQLPGNRE